MKNDKCVWIFKSVYDIFSVGTYIIALEFALHLIFIFSAKDKIYKLQNWQLTRKTVVRSDIYKFRQH